MGDGSRLVYDVLCRPDRPVVDALLAEFILDARRSRAGSIDLGLCRAGQPADRAAAGLRVPAEDRRERAAGLLDGRGAVRGEPLEKAESWYFMSGDTDF